MSDRPFFTGLDLGMRRDPSALVCSERRMIEFAGEPSNPAATPALKVLPPGTSLVIAHGRSPGAKVAAPTSVVSQYLCRHTQRFELDVAGGYPQIVCRVAGLYASRPELAGSWLVVDQTGVGAAVVDMFRKARREAVRCPRCAGTGMGLGQIGADAISPHVSGACLTCVGSGRIKLNARVAAIMISGQLGVGGGPRWRYENETDTWHVSKRELISVVLVLMESNPGRFVIEPKLKHARELTGELGMFRAKRKPDSKDESLEAWRERDHDDLVLAAAISLWFAERACRKPWVKS